MPHLLLTLISTKEAVSNNPLAVCKGEGNFGVAVSRLFPLQKPLWLRPDSNIHHKDLVYALERDWKIFFKKNELDTPKIIDSEFSIPIQNYINYWHHNFFVQEIQNPLCIISHSIGIMVDDFVNKYSILIKNLSKVQQIELNINSKSLKNLNSNDEAKFRINELVKYLDILILDLEILTGLTPRPSLQFKNNKDHSLENFKDSIWSIENKRWWIYIKNLKVNSIIFLMTVFCFFYVDHVYSQKNILLSERGFYISLIAITLSPFTLISLFLHNNYKIFFRTFITIEICCLAYFLYELIFGN